VDDPEGQRRDEERRQVEEKLLRVARLRAIEKQADRLLARAVSAARRAPAATWKLIGEFTGTTEENAHSRWRRVVELPDEQIVGTRIRSGERPIGGDRDLHLPGLAEGIVRAVLDALAEPYQVEDPFDQDAVFIHLSSRNLTVICEGIETRFVQQRRR
jgi:hypothetical protein